MRKFRQEDFQDGDDDDKIKGTYKETPHSISEL